MVECKALMTNDKSLWPLASILAVVFLAGLGAAFTLGRMEQRGDDAALAIADTKSATAVLAAAQAISDKQTGERIARLEALEHARTVECKEKSWLNRVNVIK